MSQTSTIGSIGNLGLGLASWIFSGGSTGSTDVSNGGSGSNGSNVYLSEEKKENVKTEFEKKQLLSATERDKMFRDLRYDPNNIKSEFDYPKEYVSMVLDFTMKGFNINLLGDPQPDDDDDDDEEEDVANYKNYEIKKEKERKKNILKKRGLDVLAIQLSSVSVLLQQKTQSQHITFSISTMNIYDPQCHPDRIDHHMLKQRKSSCSNSSSFTNNNKKKNKKEEKKENAPKEEKDAAEQEAEEGNTTGTANATYTNDTHDTPDTADTAANERTFGATADSDTAAGTAFDTATGDVLLSLEIELFSKESSSDTDASILMHSGPLELIYSPSCLSRVGDIFEVPHALIGGEDQAVADLNALSLSLELKAKAKMVTLKKI